MRNIPAIAVCIAALVGLAGAAHAGPLPKFDPAHPAAYLARLKWSRDAAARALARRIEEGPERLAEERSAAHAASLPLTYAELQPAPLPAERDAAPEYARLQQLLRDRPLDPDAANAAAAIGRPGGLSADETAALRKLLAQRSDVFDLLHRATDKLDCAVLPARDAHGALTRPPRGAPSRDFARLVTAESYLLLRDGHYREAVASQARGFRLAEHAGADPSVLSYLSALAMHQMALTGMEHILHRAGPNVEVADAVYQATRPQLRLSLRRALDGESVEAATTARELAQVRDSAEAESLFNVLEKGVVRQPEHSAPWSSEDRWVWMALMDAAEAGAHRRLREFADAAEDRPDPVGRPPASEPDAAPPKTRDPVETLSNLLASPSPALLNAGAHARAHQGCVAAGAAVLAFRARQGRYPARLAEALPDPQASLRYTLEPGGFAVTNGAAGARAAPLFRYPGPGH
jgi:hypothetical protein